MDELIKEISSIPGVEGICSFAANGELLDCSLESPAREKLTNACKIILRMMYAGNSNVGELSSFSIFYDKSILYARRLLSGSIIIIRHSSLTDANLVNLTILGLDIPNHQPVLQTVKEESATPLSAESECQDTVSRPHTEESQKDSMMPQSGPLANILAGMQRAFTKIEGPASNTVFREVLVKWSSHYEPNMANIKFLVDLLSKELKEKERIDRYKKMILPYMAYARDN